MIRDEIKARVAVNRTVRVPPLNAACLYSLRSIYHIRSVRDSGAAARHPGRGRTATAARAFAGSRPPAEDTDCAWMLCSAQARTAHLRR